MELRYPPFEMTDTDGKPCGVSVDLANALGAYLGKSIRIESIAFDGLIASLTTGKIDAIISSMTATKERAEAVDFSDPYVTTGLALLFSSRSPAQNIEDLNAEGRTVAVKKGTTGYLYATQHLTKPKLLVLDQENTCVLEVVQGKADAFIYDQLSTLKHWRENPQTTRAGLTAFQREAWAVALKKGNTTLRDSVNAFLNEFRSKGGFEEIGERWLKTEKAEFAKLGVPFVF